jgi:hypothetical protein
LTKSQRRPSFIFGSSPPTFLPPPHTPSAGKSNSKAEETHDAPEDCQLKKMAPIAETAESQPTEGHCEHFIS